MSTNKSAEELKKLAEQFSEDLDSANSGSLVHLENASESYKFAIANDIKPGEDAIPSVIIYYTYASWKNWKDLQPYSAFFKEFIKLFKRHRPRKAGCTGYFLDKSKFDLTTDGIRNATLKVQVHHEKQKKLKENSKKAKEARRWNIAQRQKQEKE